MECKKRSKGRGWESCYVKKNDETFGVEMRAYGQKFVKFCTHTRAAKLVVEMESVGLKVEDVIGQDKVEERSSKPFRDPR